MKKVCFFLLLLFTGIITFGQTTYTWNQAGGTADWLLSTNWTPTRSTPATNDIIVFDNGLTNTVTNVPQQTIGQMLLSNNTTVNLQSGAANNTFTIGGGTGTDLSVANGSALNINGANTMFMVLSTGATGSIAGNMTFSASNHRLDAADANAISFVSPAIFTQATGCTGAVFNATGTANIILFASGSTFIQNAGAAPFGLAQPNSKVVFQTGSLYKVQQNASPGLSGRTYANFEINAATFSQSPTGGNPLTMDNLTITDGTLNLNLTGGINIKGNISVAAGEVLTFSPASANTLTFNGSAGSQTISNFGTLTFAANTAVVIANTSATPVIFFHPQTIAGSMTVNAGSSLETRATLTLNGTPAINGSFQIGNGGWATGGVWSYGAGGTLVFNNMSGSYQVNNDAYWPTANGPVNVTVKNTGGITMNVGRTVSGLFQTTAGVINANNLTLNGTARINTGGSFTGRPNYGASSTLLYNTGGVYGRGDEWNCSGGLGCPNNLQISNNTILNVPNGSIFYSGQIQGNLTIDAGSAMYMDYGAIGQNQVVEVYKDVNLNGSLSLGDVIGGDLHVKGNWIKDAAATFNPNNRAVIFNGTTADQTITGATTFGYLVLNKSTGNLLLANNVSCNNGLTLTSGKIVLGANDLTLLSNAPSSLSAGSSTSYVVTNGTGLFKRGVGALFVGQDYHLPIGTLSNVQSAIINFTTLATDNSLYSTFYSSQAGNGGLPLTEEGDNIVKVAYNGYWEINLASPTTNVYSGTFTAKAFSDIIDYTKLHLVKRGNFLTNWQLDGTHVVTTGSNALATLKRTGMTGFSQFAVGGEGSVSLPITLLNFSGYKDGSYNQLRWTTATEINNKGFEVQRSTNGVTYSSIAFVNSLAYGGNSNQPTPYSFTDNSVAGNRQFYRLNQVDKDGKSKLSNVILIKGDKPGTVVIDGWYPNPASTHLHVAVSSPVNCMVQVQVLDITGRKINQQLKSLTEGSNTITLNVATLSSGRYTLRLVAAEAGMVSATFIKQ